MPSPGHRVYLSLNKVDDIDDGYGVVPGSDITYTISYANPITNPSDPNYIGNINDTVVTDLLPDDLAFVSASGPNSVYHPDTRTVTWDIGTLEAGESGFVTLTVKVNNYITEYGTITNLCKIQGGNWSRWARGETPVCTATNPAPAYGEISDFLCTDDLNLNLTWLRGRFAANADGHEVYFGTSFSEVNDADTSTPDIYKGTVTNPSYPIPRSNFELVTTYYWRIDEVNDSNVWKGNVWSFTTDCNLIENFNPYSNDTQLKTIWAESGRAYLTFFAGSSDANKVRDGNSMKYRYQTNVSPYYSKATATIGTGYGKLDVASDWLGIGATVLSLWFYGQPGNDANALMYLTLTDGASNSATVNYSGDMNDIRDPSWRQWNIPLTEFAGVNLADVETITIGFGYMTAGTGFSYVYFEDIHLYLHKCFPGSYPPGDFDSDCDVDFHDFAVIAQSWLTNSGLPDYNPICDIAVPHNSIIDYNDLARFCEDWLWRQAAALPMDAGSEYLYMSPPPAEQPQIEPQTEPEPEAQSVPAPEPQLQPEPQPKPPYYHFTKEDAQKLVDLLEQFWRTNEKIRSAYTEAEWQEFIESLKQLPEE